MSETITKPTFEESIGRINAEITKRRHKWNLTVLAWMDFDDVSQIIRIHINNKWHLYDPSRPLEPWVNRVISSQIKNLLRNNYGNYARPCLRCDAAEPESGCRIYTTQCNDCPLYKKWEMTKKAAHDSKLPVPLENHSQEVFNMASDSSDIEKSAEELHKHMEKVLKPIEWRVYKFLYIEGKKEEDVAKLMGYTTSEKNRTPGYKQIKNLKKAIMLKVKKAVYGDELDVM